MPKKATKALVTGVNVRDLANKYIDKNVVDDFSKAPIHQKLAILQVTPAKFIKSRKIKKKEIKYVDHIYAKKALNFVFNFRVSNEVVVSEYVSYEEFYFDYESKQKKKRTVIEAEVTMKFTFTYPDGSTETRTVHSGHKGYKNPATTRADIMKSAHSKAWTIVAGTFGIGAELTDREPPEYKDPEPEEEEMELDLPY